MGKVSKVKTLEVRWPSGTVDTLNELAVNQVVYVKEGSGLFKPFESTTTKPAKERP
jgi:hypothetical protein